MRIVRTVRGPWAEALLAVVIFGAASWWGTTYWRLSLKAGRQPEFYQLYFEPAVMVACHHGFVISHPQPKPLEDFLWRRVNTFSCDQVAGNTSLNGKGLYQGAWRYMMYTVGIAWRWLGISWTRMAPLFGLLFGLTIVAAYGIFRLGMNRFVSAAMALALSVSTLHLTNLPHLRDYSKAPFTLVLVFLLGLLVKLPVRRWAVVALAAGYGAVLGIGYGFRTDLLIEIPPILVVLFCFLDGGVRRHLSTKLLGAAAFVLAFLVTAWPILSFVDTNGGGQWHVALLGLTSPFDESLRIQPAPYSLGDVYADGYIGKTTTAYAARVRPEWREAIYFTHEYDLVTGAYYREMVSRFPGDMMTRALASAFEITRLPFNWPGPPMENLYSWLYRARESVLSRVNGAGPFLAGAAIVGVAAYDLRVGLFLLFFLLYFGGYPAIQFGTRHYFHLEFITWWAGGLLLHGVFRRPARSPKFVRAVILCAVLAALAVPLVALRLYQAHEARQIFAAYIAAGKTPIGLGTRDVSGVIRVPGPTAANDVRLMEIDLNSWACGGNAAVTFQYDKSEPSNDYSRAVPIRAAGTHDVTRVFEPVYASTFQGVVLPDGGSECVAGAYWVDPGHLPLLLSATLEPGWERRALYQRLPFEPGAGQP